jgi:hypothetical protein
MQAKSKECQNMGKINAIFSFKSQRGVLLGKDMLLK